MTAAQTLDWHNRFMIAFDLALGTGTLAAPDATLRVLGHAAPSEDARELFRRCGPIWLTFAAAHAVASVRGRAGGLVGRGLAAGHRAPHRRVWSRSPAFRDARTRAMLRAAGASNLAMAGAFAWRSVNGR